jgi:hypothetical protein
MAKASFFVNDFKVKKQGDLLVIKAQKKCIHGTVFDEVFLTLPAELMYLFNEIEGAEIKKDGDDIKEVDIAELFKRFIGDN